VFADVDVIDCIVAQPIPGGAPCNMSDFARRQLGGIRGRRTLSILGICRDRVPTESFCVRLGLRELKRISRGHESGKHETAEGDDGGELGDVAHLRTDLLFT